MGLFDKIFKKEKKPVKERNLMTIQVKDIVLYFGDDYEVTAVIDWVEEGYSWKEYKLSNKGKAFWMSVELDDGDIIAYFYEVKKNHDISLPLSKKLNFLGQDFFLEEKGHASGRISSELGTQNYQCDYWDFLSKDEKSSLSVEDFNGELEVSLGEYLNNSQIEIYPGS